MATIRYGGGITQISGSIAGNVYARNRFGNYMRPRTKPVNPNSVYQAAIRTYLSYLTTYWHETLSAANRTGWATYANAVIMKNRLGESIKLTGFNHFLRVNIIRKQLEQTLTPNAPTVLALPDKDTVFAITASAGSGKITVTWDDAAPWGDIAASVMGIWQGRPQLVTRNFFNGPWRKAGSIPGNQASPSEITAVFTLVEGQKVWVYGRISTGPTDSRLSEPFVASCTIAA
jgi:hypothetical protein